MKHVPIDGSPTSQFHLNPHFGRRNSYLSLKRIHDDDDKKNVKYTISWPSSLLILPITFGTSQSPFLILQVVSQRRDVTWSPLYKGEDENLTITRRWGYWWQQLRRSRHALVVLTTYCLIKSRRVGCAWYTFTVCPLLRAHTNLSNSNPLNLKADRFALFVFLFI